VEDVKKALKFPGGGALKVGKGQITDDSEMAMCLLHGLSGEESEII
jgi:ADP-ribosylglycohydrolase